MLTDAIKCDLCPSAQCEEGAILPGIVGQNGRVGFINQRMAVDKDFVQIAHSGRTPEKRFRFSNNCAEAGCKQWTGDSCSVIDKITAGIEFSEGASCLPTSSIRPQCRWYEQCGARARAVCPEIITGSQIP